MLSSTVRALCPAARSLSCVDAGPRPPDGSFLFFGHPAPEHVYQPLINPDLPTLEERVAHFDRWIVGYFAHGYPTRSQTDTGRTLRRQAR